MSTSRSGRRHRARALGFGLLILSLVHAPLPQADFHNVRHHDGPGQVCEHHDHLLRWHPDAAQAEDVAILHWHWFLPTSAPTDPGHAGEGPAMHAFIGGWDASTPDGGPVVVPDRSSRPLDVAPPRPLPVGVAPFTIAIDRPGLPRAARPVPDLRRHLCAPDLPRLPAPALVLLNDRPIPSPSRSTSAGHEPRRRSRSILSNIPEPDRASMMPGPPSTTAHAARPSKSKGVPGHGRPSMARAGESADGGWSHVRASPDGPIPARVESVGKNPAPRSVAAWALALALAAGATVAAANLTHDRLFHPNAGPADGVEPGQAAGRHLPAMIRSRLTTRPPPS